MIDALDGAIDKGETDPMKNNIKAAKMQLAKKDSAKTTTIRDEQTKKVSKDIEQSTDRGKSSRAKVAKGISAYIGIDLGDKKSNYCIIDPNGNIVAEETLATTQEELSELFSAIPRCRIAIEVGTHSPWVSALLNGHGHEVIVANARKVKAVHKSTRKNDKVDARTLARLVRADPELLYPIQHRGDQARQDLVLLRAREGLIAARTKLINCVRGQVKSVGGRLPSCSAESFHHAVTEKLPDSVKEALLPLVDQIGEMSQRIRTYDAQVTRMSEQKYPETERLRQVRGIGPITSLTYILTLEKPERFAKSRDVGSYLGLVPRQDESGEISKQLRITKTGDRMLRSLLVSSGQYILGPFGEDCDLRRFGLKLAERGGKNAKKRAVVAVARKLAVLLHRLWLTKEKYQPLYNAPLEKKETLAIAVNG
jgi:transposase